MRLEYEIAADDKQLRRVLRGVEGEFKASSRRTARQAGGRDQDAHVRARTNEIRRIEREEQRAADRSSKYWADAHRRSADHRIREETRAERARERETRRANRVAARESAMVAQRVRGGVARTVGGGIGTVARIGGAGLALAGGFAAAGALDQELEVGRRASQLAISAGTPEQRDSLKRDALGVRGFTGSETLGAMQGFVEKTGDLAAARAMIHDMGSLSLATSANLEEMGAAAGQAFNIIRDTVKDPKEQMKALNDVMRNLAAGGNIGAVEIKDMVTELGGLGAATRKFEGGPVGLMKQAAAMAQASIARGGAGTAPETTTAVSRFAMDLVQNQSKFSAAGVDVFAKGSNNTKLRGMDQITMDVLEKTGGDLTKINSMFGVYGERALAGFSPLFIDAEKKKKGSGRAAVEAEFKKFTSATLTDQQIKDREGMRLGDADIQLKEAAKTFNMAVGESLAPAAVDVSRKFAEFAPQIGGVAKALARFIGFLAENPAAGIGVMIGGAIAKDIASAGLGNIISGEVKGKLGAVLNGAGLGLSVATMIVTAGILNFEKRTAEIDAGGKRVTEAQRLLAQGDTAGAREVLAKQRTATDEAKKEGFVESSLKSFFNFGMFDIGTPEQKAERQAAVERASQVLDSERPVAARSQEGFEKQIEAAIATKEAAELQKQAAEALKAAAGAGGPTAKGAPARNGPINTRGS